jgi:acetyltransferase-like isoleucine patch superfamily enzyme
MGTLEEVIAKAIRNLKRKRKLGNIIVSDSYKSDSGISLSDIEESKLKEYLSNLTDLACFHGVEPAKESWHHINGMIKPVISAGIIEVAKILPYMPGADKNHLYRMIGIKIGKNTTIAPRVQFDYFHPELIEIGDNCLIGDSVKIWAHDYGLDYFIVGPVKIGNSVFIGSESVIGPGTSVGDNAKINLGALIYRRKIPANAVVDGRPVSGYKV